jgi:hypothetical protein
MRLRLLSLIALVCGPAIAAPPGMLPRPLALEALAKANVMRDPGFKPAYLKALGPLAKEYWLIDMDGPGDQTIVPFAGGRVLEVMTCKDHDCGDNNMVVLYNPTTRALYGIVSVATRVTVIGQPPAALMPELMRLRKAAWPAS